jgi:hypothetical protein
MASLELKHLCTLVSEDVLFRGFATMWAKLAHANLHKEVVSIAGAVIVDGMREGCVCASGEHSLCVDLTHVGDVLFLKGLKSVESLSR